MLSLGTMKLSFAQPWQALSISLLLGVWGWAASQQYPLLVGVWRELMWLYTGQVLITLSP